MKKDAFKEAQEYSQQLLQNLIDKGYRIPSGDGSCAMASAVATSSREMKTVGDLKKAMNDYYLGKLEK